MKKAKAKSMVYNGFMICPALKADAPLTDRFCLDFHIWNAGIIIA